MRTDAFRTPASSAVGEQVHAQIIDRQQRRRGVPRLIDTQILEIPNPNHPYGVRGVGETSIVPPLAAIANAVSNAVGVRMTHIPMSPPRILAALEVERAH